MMKIDFLIQPDPSSDALVIPVFEGKLVSVAAKDIDSRLGGAIASLLERDHKFVGKVGQSRVLSLPSSTAFTTVILVGGGKADDFNAESAAGMGQSIHLLLSNHDIKRAAVLADMPDTALLKASDAAAQMGFGATLKAYRFNKYRTDEEAKNISSLERLDFATQVSTDAAAAWKDLSAVAQGVYWARDLGNEPGNELYPEEYANRIKKQLNPLGVKIEILDEKKLEKMGAGAIIAVGKGSIRPPRLVVMKYMGGKKGDAPAALIGKGITFDAGGISLKPGAGMEDMIFDMGGSSAVVGAMKALAARKAKANVVAIVALAENMPSDRATRPGDIVSTLSGQTVEIINTDAEGRLVLCDAITYVQQKFKPAAIVDLATLTMAVMVALGKEYHGVFSNNDDLSDALIAAGNKSGEKGWRMPADDSYDKYLKSRAADLRNLSTDARLAGSNTAARFLHSFVEGDTPWAHLDIAGTAWGKNPATATGYGVQMLNNYIADNFEA